MPYKLSGVLKSPNGQPLTGVDIQFIAQQTQSPVLQQTDHNIRLGLDGAYNVTLENNTYAVKAQIGGLGPQHMGYILISSDTPAGLDLPQLLRSYSQQSTAPDYAQLIEKWLAEAKSAADTSTAQAASAKSQADRAKSEADRVSQISGLDTVADAIGLAAVPFPDVWIPFNDSLRMFAGYGREVKVGNDVVARLVNFERSTTATYIDKSGVLRTAAINEPRFEKQGLLIEGQSTNLLGYTENVVCGGPNTNNGLIDEVTPFGTVGKVAESKYKATTNTPYSDYPLFNKTYEAGVKVSTSIFVKPVKSDGMKAIAFETYYTAGGTNGVDCIFSLDSRTVTNTKGDGQVSCDILANGWVRLKMTYTTKAETKTLLRVRYLTATGNDAFSDQVLYSFGAQLEELPLASSYIPTNGTAVTRAADKCWIALPNNLPATNSNVTYAMEVEFKGQQIRPFRTDGSVSPHGIVIASSGGGWLFADAATNAPASESKCRIGMNMVVGSNNDDGAAIYINGVYGGARVASKGAQPTNATILVLGSGHAGGDPVNGHIRNLRIWHHALSDAQIKGLK